MRAPELDSASSNPPLGISDKELVFMPASVLIPFLASVIMDFEMLFDGTRTLQLASEETELSALTQNRRKSIPPVHRARESANIAMRGVVLVHGEFVTGLLTSLQLN